jgi:hypothetical protein
MSDVLVPGPVEGSWVRKPAAPSKEAKRPSPPPAPPPAAQVPAVMLQAPPGPPDELRTFDEALRGTPDEVRAHAGKWRNDPAAVPYAVSGFVRAAPGEFTDRILSSVTGIMQLVASYYRLLEVTLEAGLAAALEDPVVPGQVSRSNPGIRYLQETPQALRAVDGLRAALEDLAADPEPWTRAGKGIDALSGGITASIKRSLGDVRREMYGAQTPAEFGGVLGNTYGRVSADTVIDTLTSHVVEKLPGHGEDLLPRPAGTSAAPPLPTVDHLIELQPSLGPAMARLEADLDAVAGTLPGDAARARPEVHAAETRAAKPSVIAPGDTATLAVQFRQRFPKVSASTTADLALQDIFRRTTSGTPSLAKQAKKFLPVEVRAASPELKTIIDWASRPDVIAIEPIPRLAGQRSPDLVVYFDQTGGARPPHTASRQPRSPARHPATSLWEPAAPEGLLLPTSRTPSARRSRPVPLSATASLTCPCPTCRQAEPSPSIFRAADPRRPTRSPTR